MGAPVWASRSRFDTIPFSSSHLLDLRMFVFFAHVFSFVAVQIKAFDKMKKEIKSGKDAFAARMVRVPASELDEPFEYDCIVKVTCGAGKRAFVAVVVAVVFDALNVAC